MFRTWVASFLTHISNTPSVLEERRPDILKRLNAMCGSGQGLGNKASEHEACFAHELETHGCSMLPFPLLLTTTGHFYMYQANGTQQSIDFRLVSVQDGHIRDTVDFDLKHSSSKSIYLNDGTFLDDVVYVISFTRLMPRSKGQRKCDRQRVCAIARGQDIFTPKDRAALEKRFQRLREINADHEDLDFLRLYVRNANQYDCDKQFTPDFVTDRFQKTLAWISPPPPQI
jgi:hypothetical protein